MGKCFSYLAAEEGYIRNGPDSDEPHLRVSTWKSWVSDFKIHIGDPVCIFCVCASVLFFRAKLSSLAYFLVRWEERHYLVYKQQPGLPLCSLLPQSYSLSALPISGGSCQLPHLWGHSRETSQPEPLNFSVMKSGCLDLFFSPAVMCWIKML